MWIDFYKILLNYPNQLFVPENSLGNVKKNLYSNMKMPVFKVVPYKHFFVKTLVQISTLTKVHHLISEELYQKQNGFKFI